VSTLEAGVLTRLAELRGGAGLTIDFSVAPIVGHPLVLLGQPRVTRPPGFDALTAREREVAACVAAGLPNRQIAQRLCLSTATVKDHVHRILVKTGLPNRTAIAAAWRGGGQLGGDGRLHP
jgi:DNA-binding NarL/FixJ family response regulator